MSCQFMSVLGCLAGVVASLWLCQRFGGLLSIYWAFRGPGRLKCFSRLEEIPLWEDPRRLGSSGLGSVVLLVSF